MSKKFSIVKEIDLNKLGRKIDDYRHETGENYPYIFASSETIREMVNNSSSCFVAADVFAALSSSGKGRVGTFEGYKLYPNEDLKYGEVELR